MAPADVRLFLLGSVWGALALQRGLLPLHASAVGRGRTVHAFTGPPGAGKSTLAAALAARGYPLFTDDMLDPGPRFVRDAGEVLPRQSGPEAVPDASVLTGAVPGTPVRAGVGKAVRRPCRWSPHIAGRLRTLHCLSYSTALRGTAAHCRIERLTRRRATFALYDALFRPRQAVAIVGRRRLFESLLGRGGPACAGVGVPSPAAARAVRGGRGVPGRGAAGPARDAVNAAGGERAPGHGRAPAAP